MSRVSSITGLSCNSTPAFKASMASFPKKTATVTMDDVRQIIEQDEKKKEKRKKLVIGGALIVIFIEFILSRSPARRAIRKEYEQIFSNSSENVQRAFPSLPLRDNIVVNEILNGNDAAKALYPTLTDDAPNVVKYMKAKQKLERAEKYYAEGRFDHFTKSGKTKGLVKDNFLHQLEALRRKVEELYERYMAPISGS